MQLSFVHYFVVHLLVCYISTSQRPQEGQSLIQAVTCGLPPSLPNSRSNQSRSETSFPVGYVIQYTCTAGYQRVGHQQGLYATCRADGQQAAWDGPQVTCQLVTCEDPGQVDNADRTLTSMTYGSYVTYSCRIGYTISGRDQRICQADGQWSGANPQCNIVQCSNPEHPEFGTAIFSSVTFGSDVRYECRNMRRVEGNERRTCMASGNWNGTTPSCVVVDCGLPPDNFTSGWAKVEGTTLGRAVIYQCETGGPTFRSVCLYTGEWHPATPACMYVPVSTTEPEQPTPRERGCSNRFTCFFRGVRNSICNGLRRIGVRMCQAN